MASWILARPRHGTVGETQRVAHVFPAAPPPAGRPTALCGASFDPTTLEQLNGPDGAPCVSCLLRTPG